MDRRIWLLKDEGEAEPPEWWVDAAPNVPDEIIGPDSPLARYLLVFDMNGQMVSGLEAITVPFPGHEVWYTANIPDELIQLLPPGVKGPYCLPG